MKERARLRWRATLLNKGKTFIELAPPSIIGFFDIALFEVKLNFRLHLAKAFLQTSGRIRFGLGNLESFKKDPFREFF